MINGKKVLAIVPARGGSKGIPKKNIIDVLGKPLIQYTLDEAAKSNYIDKIHISTDSFEIAEKVKSLGYEVERLRPEVFARDESQTIDVLIDVLTYYKSLDLQFEIVVLLQPTQPLRKATHIDEALSHYIHNNYEGLVSVSLVEQHPILMRSLSKEGRLNPILSSISTVRRQDFDEFYIVNGAIYINSVDDVLKRVSLNDNPIPYIMDGDYSNIDIDDFEDLERLRLVLKNKEI